MDQRRFLIFLILSLAVLILSQQIFPPPPKPKAPPASAQAEGQAAPGENLAENAEQQAGQAEQQPPQDAPPADVLQVAAVTVPEQYATLGSLDPATGYRMLVTLTNVGAAVRRAELSSPRFLDQHDWSGYLGELELVDADDGVEIRVVGAGTPAAAAGLEVGDVIVGINSGEEVKIATTEAFAAALAKTKPRDEIAIQVRRGDGPAQSRTVKLVRRPFAVVRPEIDNLRMRDAEPPPGFVDSPSFLTTLTSLNGKPLKKTEAERLANVLERGTWEVTDQNATSVTFRRQLPELTFNVLKRYTLEAAPAEHLDDVNYPAYHIKLDVELQNAGDSPQAGLAYRLLGPTGMPIEGWWFAHKTSQQRWFGGAGLRDVVVRFNGQPWLQIDGPLIAEGEAAPMGQEALAYGGVSSVYFAAVLLPIKPLEETWFESTEAIVVGPKPDARTPLTFTNVSTQMTRLPLELAAGAVHRDSYQVFLGPMRPDLLAQYKAGGNADYSLSDIVFYGSFIFAAVARAMLFILHFFYDIFGNYGIAIIALTVVVRGALFPISFKQTQNMARMQALKPEMDRITEKYKNDMQKRSQAIQELYRKHRINPLGGCLPVFLQLPIFIGLYRALAVDVELRQSPLFSENIRWVSNLAAPDMFYDWSSWMPNMIQGSLGPYLNVLPLVTVGLFLVTQKMAMPAPTNEQAAMQQKMMKYMTIFMGFLFYKVASGLCLYFIASSLWGIAERKMLPKATTPESATSGGAGGTSSGPNGKRPGDGGSPKPTTNGSPGGNKRRAKRKK